MAKRAFPKGKTLEKKVEDFGLSMPVIELIKSQYGKTNKSATLIRGFAKFMLVAESREELKWRPFAKAVLGEIFESSVRFEKAKYVTFNLPGNNYKPDFTYILEDGQYVNVEVKGSVFQPGYRDARSKLRMCATLNPDQRFVEVMPNKESLNGWSIELIEPDKDYADFIIKLHSLMEKKDEI